jgi:hypothetical protein
MVAMCFNSDVGDSREWADDRIIGSGSAPRDTSAWNFVLNFSYYVHESNVPLSGMCSTGRWAGPYKVLKIAKVGGADNFDYVYVPPPQEDALAEASGCPIRF